ncbi:MAG TPA: molybdate ABC transporter substrate-binding protein [Rhizomicrobium sp.]
MKALHLTFAAAWLWAGSTLSVATAIAQTKTVTVFAAASLTDALNTIGKSYEAKTGRHVALVFAASSTLARQIEASAGADVFISADTEWMDYLDSKGLMKHETRRNLLGNHLVLIAPADSKISLRIAPHFNLLGALGNGRLAIADPDSVPAGKYGRQALTRLGVWNSIADRLASAENVRVALAYVARRETPLGIVYTTDAMSEARIRIVDTFPDITHTPIAYPAALTKDAKPDAAAFLAFLSSADATSVFTKAGFVVLH